MARQLEHTQFISVQFYANKIASSAHTAFWLNGKEGQAASDFFGQVRDINEAMEQIAALMGLRLVDAEPDPRPLPNLEDA